MKRAIFKKLVSNRIKRCTELMLGAKQAEYNPTDNVLHNFDVSGRIKDESPGKALWGMWVKHITSIQDCINRMEEDPNYVPSKKFCNDKFDDNINYTLLFEAVVERRRANLGLDNEDDV